jgi:hypothetical protein
MRKILFTPGIDFDRIAKTLFIQNLWKSKEVIYRRTNRAESRNKNF